MRFKFLVILLILGLQAIGIAQSRLNERQFQGEIDALLKSEAANGLDWSVKLVHLESQKEYTWNEDKKLIPASLVKLITASQAIDHWPYDKRFYTLAGYSGTISDGVLDGNVYIIGQGDPSFCSKNGAEINLLLLKLSSISDSFMNVKEITGHVILATGYFDRPPSPSSWKYGDMGNYYAAGVFALPYHRNFYFLSFQQNKTLGKPVEVASITPEVPGLEIDCQVVTGQEGSGDNAYIHGSPYSNRVVITGTIPPGDRAFTIKGAIPNPTDFYKAEILKFFNSENVKLHGEVKEQFLSPDEIEYTKFDSYGGPTVGMYLKTMLRKSDNQIAEYFSYHLRKEGVAMLESQKDGSGLSTENRLSASEITNLLTEIGSWKRDTLIASLPIGGVSGTLKNRFSKEASGMIAAKTGSMKNVQSLAGYILNSEGEPEFAFAYLINGENSKTRKLSRSLDQILQSIVK